MGKFSDRILNNDLMILKETENVLNELKATGRKERTLDDYKYHMQRFCKICEISRVRELNKANLLKYLNYNDVSASTKRIRLKHVRAVLNIMHANQVLETNFWSSISIKVSEPVKRGSTESDIFKLLDSLDLDDRTELRDACLFLQIWETGARVGTIVQTTLDMIDFENKLITYPGTIMKSGQSLILPVSDNMIMLLKEYIHKNSITSGYLYTSRTNRVMTSTTVSKRVSVYRERTGLSIINPHAIRRGFAKRLLNSNVNIAIISKALAHSSLEVTTKYLHIGEDELIDSIRQSWNN